MGPKPKSVLERFWPKVDKRGPDECWPWLAATDKGGYGRFKLPAKEELAHRAMWLITFGTLTPDMWILHRCDNPPCVNPKHLFPGNQEINRLDMMLKGRHTKGVDQAKSKLVNADVIEIRRLYATGKFIQSELASQFKVCQRTINKVVNHTGWFHV